MYGLKRFASLCSSFSSAYSILPVDIAAQYFDSDLYRKDFEVIDKDNDGGIMKISFKPAVSYDVIFVRRNKL